MAAEIFVLQQVLIDQEPHMVVRIVHQAQNADGAGSDA